MARSELQLLQAQLAALTAYRRHVAAQERAEVGLDPTEAARRRRARAAGQAAVVARTDLHLRESAHPLAARLPVRAVLVLCDRAHRQEVARELEARGVDVLASLADGAVAAGTLVVEQADVLLLEAELPGLSGAEVLQGVRGLSPGTRVLALSDPEQGRLAADAVVCRRASAADVAQRLLELLDARQHAERNR